ncbi:hypothetical protein [Peribacillus simplex]|uniref:hypothetical protein n=1 Tax=Peribacillus simplex TaxID=1478 RepID=UPI00366FADFD
MKKFIVCYTLDNDIKREKILKGPDVNKEDVLKDALDKIERSDYFIAKTDQREYRINSSLIRYIQVLHEMHCFKYHTDHQ